MANAWSMGPQPFPKSSIADNAPDIYSFALETDSDNDKPLARFAAIALESVQPVPWVLGLSIRFPLNQISSPFA